MKNKFKRALSSVLAFAMVLSCLTVMNVSSVFAETTELSATVPSSFDSTYTTITNTDDGVKYVYDFGKFADDAVTKGLNSGTNYNFTLSDGKVTGGSSISDLNGDYFYGLSTNSKNLQVVEDSSNSEVKFSNADLDLYFTIATGCSAEMSITTGTGGGTATVTDDNSGAVTATNNIYSLLSSGTYHIKRNDKLFIKTLEITVAASDMKDGVITYAAPENGTLAVTTADGTVVSGNTVAGGTSVTVTVNPADGYRLSTLTVGGTDVTSKVSNNVYTFPANGNTEIVAVFEEDKTASCDYWFDTASSTKAGTYTLAGGTLTLYSDFAASKSYTYGNHTSYAGSPAKATADGNNIGYTSATAPDAGNAYSFKPAADGTIKFYSGTSSDKTYSIVTKDTNNSLSLNATADTEVTVAGKAGYTYYVFGNSSTSNSAFIGFQYIIGEQAEEPTASTFIYDEVITDDTDKTTVYVIGKISADDVNDPDAVGFGLGTAEETAVNSESLSSTTVYKGLKIGDTVIGSDDDGYYYAGFKIKNDVTDLTEFFASAFSKTGETATHGDAQSVAVDAPAE